jgi:hypothetical protein
MAGLIQVFLRFRCNPSFSMVHVGFVPVPWYFAVIEAEHELQNPTSPEKNRLLGTRLGLGPGSHVLDIGSGRGGPALVLAETFGCRTTCVEQADVPCVGSRTG